MDKYQELIDKLGLAKLNLEQAKIRYEQNKNQENLISYIEYFNIFNSIENNLKNLIDTEILKEQQETNQILQATNKTAGKISIYVCVATVIAGLYYILEILKYFLGNKTWFFDSNKKTVGIFFLLTFFFCTILIYYVLIKPLNNQENQKQN